MPMKLVPRVRSRRQVFYAASKLRRKLYDECAAICTVLLAKNPYDQVRAAGSRDSFAHG